MYTAHNYFNDLSCIVTFRSGAILDYRSTLNTNNAHEYLLNKHEEYK